jgi:glucosyl-3-phosphoglycerate synthase
MPDFYQHRHVTTLHYLKETDLGEVEGQLGEFAKERPIALVLPALYSELQSPALPRILGELAEVRYIEEIILSMNRMSGEEFGCARRFVGERLPAGQRWRILWNDGPRVSALYGELSEHGLTTYVPGKGYNVWMAWGYVAARGRGRIVAAHDSDILSYSREMLGRLLLPTAHPSLGYEFCKSYYGRVSDRMYGRVTRLFVGPLLRAFSRVLGRHPMLEFLDDFRYPLSGEFSMTTDVAQAVRIPGNWGLEVGMLCEVWRNLAAGRMCQADLGVNFEHKHQHLGYDLQEPRPEPKKGLMKMAHDIALTLLHNLCSEGLVIGRDEMRAIRLSYERMAKESIKRYHDDAVVNGLKNHERHIEAEAVEAYRAALDHAAEAFCGERVLPSPHVPNWNRIFSAMDGFGDRLMAAVEADNG